MGAEKERLVHTGKRKFWNREWAYLGPQLPAAMRREDRMKAAISHPLPCDSLLDVCPLGLLMGLLVWEADIFVTYHV